MYIQALLGHYQVVMERWSKYTLIDQSSYFPAASEGGANVFEVTYFKGEF